MMTQGGLNAAVDTTSTLPNIFKAEEGTKKQGCTQFKVFSREGFSLAASALSGKNFGLGTAEFVPSEALNVRDSASVLFRKEIDN